MPIHDFSDYATAEKPVERVYDRMVWVIDGKKCYSCLVKTWDFNEDGTVTRDGQRLKWLPMDKT